MPEEGFAGANVTVPHKGAALALADVALRDGARDRRRQHAQLRRRRDPRRQHRRARAAGGAARRRRRGSGRWCWARAAPRARWSGRCFARGPRSMSGTARTLRARNLCEELGGAPVVAPDADRLPADRQLDLGRIARRGPLRRASADARAALFPGRPSSTLSTAAGPSGAAGCRGGRGGDGGRRDRGPRPPGRPLPPDLDRPRSRRSTRCVPRRAAGGRSPPVKTATSATTEPRVMT